MRIRGWMSLLLLLASVGALPARAEIRPKSFEVELFGGYYDPRPGQLEGEPAWGGRLGYNVSSRVNVQFGASYVQFSGNINEPMVSGPFELDLLNVDLSLAYQFVADNRVVPEVHGGIGGSFTSTSGVLTVTDLAIIKANGVTDDTFTLHAGGGLKIALSDLIYVRPVIRARWFNDRREDRADLEYTLSLGFQFGGRRSL